MSDDTGGTFVFGLFDGMTSIVGVIVGMLAAHGSTHALIVASVGLAAAATFSMAAGEYLGDDSRNLRNAASMGVATLFGTLLPIAPFMAFSRTPATITSAALALAACALIAHVRARFESTVRAWVETYGLFLGVTALTVLVVLVTGAGS